MSATLPVRDLRPPVAGWVAQLTLDFVNRGPRTVLGACKRTGPLAVQRAFYPEGAACHTYLLHPPGGVAGGDTLNVDTTVGEGAHAVVTTPGATKFYGSNGPLARQTQTLEVADAGVLEWLPQENIFFERARVHSHTHIEVARTAAVAYWEIHCLGRPANDITFASGTLDTTLVLSRQSRPVLIERLRASGDNLNDAAGLRGHPICATAIFGPVPPEAIHEVREHLDVSPSGAGSRGLSGVTRIDEFLVVRHLGPSSAHARDLFASIWDVLRPEIAGLAPCQPRIWRT